MGVGCPQSIESRDMVGARDTVHWGSIDPPNPPSPMLLHFIEYQSKLITGFRNE
jgi:hypothetical protein